jgi:general secretion pathway protein M
MSGQAVRRRAVAVAILVLVIAALWFGPVSGYLALVADGARQIADNRSILERYRGLLTLSADAIAWHGERMSQIMLPEGPEGATIAALQEGVKEAATSNQVELQSFQILHAESLSGASKLGVRIRGTGEIAGIARMLYAIEAARPVLYPDNFSIRSRPDGAGKPGEKLDFQLDVSGFKAGAL